MITLEEFLKKENIVFGTQKQALSWLKGLKPKSLAKVGETYFVEEEEIQSLFENYIAKKISTRKKRAATARKNFKKKMDDTYDKLLG